MDITITAGPATSNDRFLHSLELAANKKDVGLLVDHSISTMSI